MVIENNPNFLQKYSFTVLAGLPGTGAEPARFHRKENMDFYSEGFVVKVVPQLGDPWIGNFQFGDGKYSGVYSWPDETHICVVARGQGYIVNIQNPSQYDWVEAYPITEVIQALEKGLIIFVDYTKVIAYNRVGKVWVTERISWDGIAITQVTSDHIEGEAWSPEYGKHVKFNVDLETGQHEGGAYIH